MESNGWKFDISHDVHGHGINTQSRAWSEDLKHQKRCNLDTWFGFKGTANETGMVTASFKSKGKGILTFGNCGDSTLKSEDEEDFVWVYLNEKKISGAWQGRNGTSVHFSYGPGDKLKIEETGNGMIKMNAFVLECASHK